MTKQQSKDQKPVLEKARQVFFVEKNCADIALVRRAMTNVGYIVHLEVLQTAEALIETLLAQEPQVGADLILTDLNLPDDSAFPLSCWLRKNPSTIHTPIVMISNRKQESEILRSYESGASSVIEKPAAFTDYAQMLKDVCSYWLNVSRMPNYEYVKQVNQLIANVS